MQISNSSSVVRGKMEQIWEGSGGGGISKQQLHSSNYGASVNIIQNPHIKRKQTSQSQHQSQQQQSQLSYQSTRLSQYIQLQLSQLQNTLHYIQKKHSLNQIKQSISHSYNIFCQTQTIFKQLKANTLYAQVKKLVNCYSIIYVVLMDKIQTGNKDEGSSAEDRQMKVRVDAGSSSNSNIRKDSNSNIRKDSNSNIRKDSSNNIGNESDTNIKTKTTIKSANEPFPLLKQQSQSTKSCKPKQLGGIHLYNQQYNRHIQSDQDRLKRKVKQQLEKKPSLQLSKKSQKQKLKQEILKQLNSNYIDSTLQGADELQLFLNLNSNSAKGGNKFGSELQLITFQDQLQQIAAFFKQSQDQAIEFLNKSRDQYQALNFNSGFKQTLTLVKSQKDQQMNKFILKFRNMFERMKQKAIEKEKEINLQVIDLKKLQQKLAKPSKIDMQTQTIISYQEQIMKMKREIQELTRSYTALQQLHKIQNEKEEKEITQLQQKLALAQREESFIKKQIQEKNHFINFLNQKINQNTDTKLLKKFSMLYKNHTTKNTNKLKVELQQIEKDKLYKSNHNNSSKPLSKGASAGNNPNENNNNIDSNNDNTNENDDNSTNQQPITQSTKSANQQSIQQQQHQRVNKKSYTSPMQDFQKPNKKKRKPGMSLFATPDKRLSTAIIDKKPSLNFINEIVQQVIQQNMVKENTLKQLSEYQNGKGFGWLGSGNNWQSGKSSEQSSRKEVITALEEGQLSQHMNEPEEQNPNNEQIVKQGKDKKLKKKISIIKSSNNNNNIKGMSSSQVRAAIGNNSNGQKLKKTSSKILQQKKSYFGVNSGSKLKSNSSSRKGSKQSTIVKNDNQDQLQRNRISIVKEEEQEIRNSEANNNNINQRHQQVQQVNTHMTEQQQLMMELNKMSNTISIDNNQHQQQQDNQSDEQQLEEQEMSWEQYQKQVSTKQEQSGDKLAGIEEKTLRKTNGSNQRKTIGSNVIDDTRSAVQNSLATKHSNNNNSKGIQSLQNSNNTSRIGNTQHQSNNYLTNQLSTKIQNHNTNINNSNDNFNEQKTKQLMLMPIDDKLEQSVQLIDKLNQLSHMQGVNNQQKEEIINTYINSLYKAKKSKKSMLMSNMVHLSIQIDKHSEDYHQQANQSKKYTSPNSQQPHQQLTPFTNKIIKKQSSTHISYTKNNRSKLQNQSQHQLNILSNTHMSNNNRSKKHLTNNKVTQKQHHLSTQQHELDQDDSQMLLMRKYDQQQYILNSTQGDKKTHRKTIEAKTYINQNQYERIYSINSSSKNNLSSTFIHQYDQDKFEDYFEKNAIKTAMKSINLQQFKAKIKKIHQAKCGENCKHLQRYIQNFNKYRTNNRETLKIHVQDVNHTIIDEGTTPKINKESPLSFPSINLLNTTGFSSKGFITGQKSSAKLLPKK